MSTYSRTRDTAIFAIAVMLMIAGIAGAYQIAEVRHEQAPAKPATIPRASAAPIASSQTSTNYPYYPSYYPPMITSTGAS
ncbi:MAG: hypothetical protein ACYDDF_14585 [Thermoplasmatota archaeon]